MENVFIVKLEINMALKGNVSASWRDVTNDAIGTTKCSIGINGNGPLDRVASTGTLFFTLRNENNKYTPGHSARVYDLTSGSKVRLSFISVGRGSVTKFYGFIPPSGIDINIESGFNTVDIEAVDYIEQLATHELELPAYTTNKRIDQVAALILANMHVQPLSTSFDTGQDTFATVFDTVKSTTLALSEFEKLAASELGYVYVVPKTTSDETLVVESRKTRNGKSYSTVNVWTGETSYLLLENGDHLLLEDGGKFELENIYSALYPEFTSDNIRVIKVVHAENYYNTVKTNVYPRRQGAAGEVLYVLERVIQVAAGATVHLTGRFKDPNQEAQSVSGINMINPAATTDYLMNSAADGTGTDMTASLSVTASYGTNGADYTLTNNHATTTGYITKLQARGTGVYIYRQAERTEKDTALVDDEGKYMLTLNMSYQDNPLIGTDFAVYLLSQYKEKLTTIDSISMIANKSTFLINTFLDISLGSKIHVHESDLDIDRAFFVNSLDFTVQPGGLVTYSWGLKDSLYDTFDAWILGTDQLGTTTVLGY